MSLLEIQHMTIQQTTEKGKSGIIKDLSYHMEPGEIMGMIGESGSGKSMSMLAILGLLPKQVVMTGGKILFEGKDAVGEQLRGKEIAMVLQDPMTSLNPVLRIGTQIMETVKARRSCSKKEAKERTLSLLSMVGIPEPQKQMKQYPFELSGGMRQRVVIAIALACEPKLILADEPTTSLDVTVQSQILELLKKTAKETGAAVLVVSHDLAVVASICSRILIVKEGQAVEEGTVEDIFYEPQHPYTKLLLQHAKKITGEKKTWGTTTEKPVQEMEKILRVREVRKQFSFGQQKTEAVKGVSFAMERGTTFGLVGESGCGKSTLARMITGAYKPDNGAIYYGDVRLDQLNETERRPYYQNIQMIFQDPYASLNPRLTVEEIIKEPLIVNQLYNEKIRQEKTEQYMETMGLDFGDRQRYPHEFSGGQCQRIGIARALILEPEVLICDEPVSALDVSVRVQIMELLERIQKEKGISYLFIAHDLGMVRQMSRTVGVMYQGCIVEQGPVEAVYAEPWHPYTKELLSAAPVADPLTARRKKRIFFPEEFSGKETGGCPFARRCRYALERCQQEKPKMHWFQGRGAACFLYGENDVKDRFTGYTMSSQI
ncbi:MAG: ABC transporter ATP-binding protein [Lachnospiraceae bacterium]